MRTNKIYSINKKLKHTRDTIQDLEEIYLNNTDEFPPLLDEVVLFLKEELTEFERSVFLLHCEYQSLRNVSDETNVSSFVVHQIVKKVKDYANTIKNNKNNE